MTLTRMAMIFVCCFFVQYMYAQNAVPDSMINVVPQWALNDTAYYSKEHDFWQILENDTISKRSEQYIIRIVFLGETEVNYEVEWTYFLVKDSLLNDSIIYYYEPLYSLNYYIDSLGVFVDADVLDLSMKHMQLLQMTQRIDKTKSLGVLKSADAYDNTTSVRNIMLEDIMEYHRYFGYMYTSKDTIVRAMYDANSSEEIPKGVDKFKVTIIDSTEYYTIVSEEKIFSDYLKKTYETKLNTTNYSLRERGAMSQLMSNMSGIIKREWIFHETGWLISGFYQKDITTNHMTITHNVRLSFLDQ